MLRHPSFGIWLLASGCLLAFLTVTDAHGQLSTDSEPSEVVVEQADPQSPDNPIGIDSGPRVRQLGNTPDDLGNRAQEAEEQFDSLLPFGPLTPLRESWKALNHRLRAATGLDFSFNYTVAYQHTDWANGPRDAAGGDFDLFGRWEMPEDCCRIPGQLALDTETRHSLGVIPPAELGSNIGSLWGTTVGYDVQDFTVYQLYWDQGSFEDGFRYRIGRTDAALIYDGYRYASDNYAFFSPAFSDTLPMPLPGSGLGAALAVYPYGETYVVAGVHDANGSKTRSGFDTFFGESEYFSAIEFGMTPNFGQEREGLYHITAWHTDARRQMGRPSDRGIAVTLEQQTGCNGNIVPFLRYAYSHRGLNGVRQNLSIGVGLEEVLGKNADMIGCGFGWGQPSNRQLRDQYTFEAFYRIFLTPAAHLTPDIQVIVDPSNAPTRESVTVFSLRLRTVF